MFLWLLRRFDYVKRLERACSQHEEYMAGKVTLEEIAIENNAISIKAGTELARIMASQFLAVLDETDGATNYVEITLADKSGRRVIVTIQRWDGKTPHELRRQVQSELDALKASLVLPSP